MINLKKVSTQTARLINTMLVTQCQWPLTATLMPGHSIHTNVTYGHSGTSDNDEDDDPQTLTAYLKSLVTWRKITAKIIIQLLRPDIWNSIYAFADLHFGSRSFIN